MKRIHLVVVASWTLLTLTFALAQPRRNVRVTTATVEVTTQSIARQPRGKPYVMDLTRKGKTYRVASDVANRVRVRTSEGEMTMTDFMSKLGVTSGRFLPGSKFLMGTATCFCLRPLVLS